MGNKKSNRRSTTKVKIGNKQLQFFILKLMSRNQDKHFNISQILGKIKVKNSIDSVAHAVEMLKGRGLILSAKDGSVYWNPNNSATETQDVMPSSVYTGKVDMTRSGAAYIILEDMEQDVYIPARQTGTAMHGDIVKIEIPRKSGRRKPEGKIISVVKRAITHVIGTLKIYKQYAIVHPILEGKFPEVFIHPKDIEPAKDGQYVLAEITEWGMSQNKDIWGKVEKVLHKMNQNDVAMQSILLSNGFPLEFPDHVLKQAEAIDGTITPEIISQRRDFREILTFTIDPATAKDFDDAISYRVLENGNTEVGVHIADVTQYLKENSALDKEAYERSTSVYLVDRVIPMLPERLSNDLCSLNPNEDKCTFSAVFEFDEKYKIVSEWFGRTLIHSARRFSYEEAQERLESGEGDLVDELRKINAIAHKLRKDRMKKGSINFDSDEVQFELDENNKPIGVYVKERKDAHLLVEDFMLLANKAVATFLFKKAKPEVPAVYRTHDLPDLDRLADFSAFAKELGYNIKLDNPDKIAQSLNQLTEASREDESLKMLLPLAIRTMAKAEYTTENIGHYGLAFDYYTHFTSPIRRYSDVLVHRILFENLEGIMRRDKDLLEAKCKHISRQERKAMDCERESIKYKQVEYMVDKVGQIFHGVISGMIEKGIFVEVVESKAEGMIPFSRLGDSFVMETTRLKAVSKRTGEELKMGSKVLIRLDDADLDSRLLEFTLMEMDKSQEG